MQEYMDVRWIDPDSDKVISVKNKIFHTQEWRIMMNNMVNISRL